ncbi:MAG: IS1380 family transposase [Balneolaceae bacterium]|nr:IS1380 family transposase [Balneolaceae bacterium]
MGRQLDDPKFDRHLASLVPHQRRRGRISDGDIARTMIGLICVGKPHFDAVAEFGEDRFFRQALGLETLPSAEILRQRIQGMPEKVADAFRDFTTRLLGGQQDLLAEEYRGDRWMPIHIDVTPMDNSGSHKEGVSCTYKKFDGYAPIVAYAGPHGFMLNNQLRAGSSHCNCEGTAKWLEQTLKRAEAVAPEGVRRLVVTDAGHDAAENLLLFTQTPDTDFVVKRNLRRSDPADWLAKARRQTNEPDQLDRGARAWYGQRVETVTVGASEEEGADQQLRLRVVWRATERTAEPDGQLLTEPEVTIDAWWTSLDWDPEHIQTFYQQRGTSGRFPQ